MPELSVTEEQLERLEALRTELESTFVDGYAHVRRHDAVDYLLDTYTPPAEERIRQALDRRVRDEDGEIDYPALQSVARNTEGVKGSGTPAEEMYAAVLEAKVQELEAGRGVGVGTAPGGDSDGAASGEGERSPGVDTDADGDGADTDVTDDAEQDADVTDDAEQDADVTDESVTDEDGDTLEEGLEPAEVDEAGAGADEESGGPGAITDDESADPADSEGTATASTVSASSDGGGSPLEAMMNLLETHGDRWRKAEAGDAPYEVDLPDGGTEAARTKDDVKRILFRNY